MRSSILSMLTGALLASPAAANLAYKATVLQDDRAKSSVTTAASSAVKFVPVEPGIHLPFRNATLPNGAVNEKRASTVFSRNWCGSVQPVASGDTYSSVSGIFSVPNLKLRSGIATPQYASSSIGFDGATCQNVFLQAGASTQIGSDGTQKVSVWLDWYPDGAFILEGFPAATGDWILVKFDMTANLKGKVLLQNYSQGYALQVDLSGATSLCRSDATWLVSDSADGTTDDLPFAAFADIWFEQTQATTTGGSTVGVTGATLYSLIDSAFQVKCEAVNYDNSNFYVYSTN